MSNSYTCTFKGQITSNNLWTEHIVLLVNLQGENLDMFIFCPGGLRTLLLAFTWKIL